MEQRKLEPLIRKYLAGDCTDEERDLVEQWHSRELASRQPQLTIEELEHAKHQIWDRIVDANTQKRRSSIKRKVFVYAAAAVACFLAATLAIYQWENWSSSTDYVIQPDVPEAINPGSAKATLMLADGRSIQLDPDQFGVITAAEDIRFSQNESGLLEYTPSQTINNETPEAEYNQITTPRGGSYQLLLSDGSKAWLNASSSIRFPTVFTADHRKIFVEGEVYLEVAHDKNRPFSITVGEQVIQVLGTDLNIEAYADQALVKTTLVEGRIRIDQGGNSIELMPGQQSSFNVATGKTTTYAFDAESAIAWKNNKFVFNDEYIEDIMNKIARWYDVDVSYHGQVKHKRFAGEFSRFSDINDVLQLMELTGTIQFTIEGRRIIVKPG